MSHLVAAVSRISSGCRGWTSALPTLARGLLFFSPFLAEPGWFLPPAGLSLSSVSLGTSCGTWVSLPTPAPDATPAARAGDPAGAVTAVVGCSLDGVQNPSSSIVLNYS